MDLRCHSRILHCVIDDDAIEVACQSKWCGKKPGVTVVHRFNKHTGELLDTRKFKTPKEVNRNAPAHQGTSVRSA